MCTVEKAKVVDAPNHFVRKVHTQAPMQEPDVAGALVDEVDASLEARTA
jgi:hypothetical protein